jgi:hypothetical protein
VRELEQCVTLWPAHYNAWFKLYRAHTLLGNEEKAAQSLKQHDHWKATSQGDPAGRGPRPGTGGGG